MIFFSNDPPKIGRSLYDCSRIFNIFIFLLALMVVGSQTRPQEFNLLEEKCDCNLPLTLENRADFVCCDGSKDHGNTKLRVILNMMRSGNIFVDKMQIRRSFALELFKYDLNIDMLQLVQLDYQQLLEVDIKKNDHIKKLLIQNVKELQHHQDDGQKISFLDKIQTHWNALEMLYLDNYSHIMEKPGKFDLFKSPFSSNHKLESLTMNHCHIKSLRGVNLLQNVASLRMLSLAYNNLTTIDNLHFFPSQTNSKLWFLDLSYNQLEKLPEKWPLPKTVTHIHLEHNYLTELPVDFYQRKFKEFWFQGNLADCSKIARSFGKNIPTIFVCFQSKSFPSPIPTATPSTTTTTEMPLTTGRPTTTFTPTPTKPEHKTTFTPTFTFTKPEHKTTFTPEPTTQTPTTEPPWFNQTAAWFRIKTNNSIF